MNIVSKGDYVLYKSLDKNITLYKVTNEPETITTKGKTELSFRVTLINHLGEPAVKSFTTTMCTVDGRRRIFKYWLQPGDEVWMKHWKTGGTVSAITMDSPDNICIEVTTSSQQLIFNTTEEAVKFIEVLPYIP